jgi:hypothetical protein
MMRKVKIVREKIMLKKGEGDDPANWISVCAQQKKAGLQRARLKAMAT